MKSSHVFRTNNELLTLDNGQRTFTKEKQFLAKEKEPEVEEVKRKYYVSFLMYTHLY